MTTEQRAAILSHHGFEPEIGPDAETIIVRVPCTVKFNGEVILFFEEEEIDPTVDVREWLGY